MKKKLNISHARLFNHLHKVKKRHVEKFMHTWIHTHHALVHIGELAIIGVIGFSSLLFANYNNSYQHLYRSASEDIIHSLANAIQKQKPKTNESKIISIREMDGNVNNTFAPGYCTYGAARISPEFFPYSEDKMSQERTRGGNAIDRCENAEAAGFRIGNTPIAGSLIVYSKVGSNSTFGHVGKIMYYNKSYKSLIVRDMNWIGKFIMSDRREESDNVNIKCFIYPGKTNTGINNIKLIDTGSIETTISINPLNNLNNDNQTTTTPIKTGSNNINTSNNTNNNSDIKPIDNTPNNTNTNTNTNIKNESDSINNQIEIIEKEPENDKFYNQSNIVSEENIKIESKDNFSDITKHFLSQYNLDITIIKKNILSVGESIKLNIKITNKETNETYRGILPFILNSIVQNNLLEGSLQTMQLTNGDDNIIYFKAIEKGESSILITIDDQKIVSIPVIIN